MQQAFYFDQSRCIGCNTCVVACKDWNGVPPGRVTWRRLVTEEIGVFPDVDVRHLLLSCPHCVEPACVDACSVNAIAKREQDGIVVADRLKCTGDRKCFDVCPFEAPQFASVENEREEDWKIDHPMQKCTFCVDRLTAGKKPACVDSCIGFPDPARSAKGELLPGGSTQPAIYFKPR